MGDQDNHAPIHPFLRKMYTLNSNHKDGILFYFRSY